ncbi:MAG: glycosyltransferase family 2 protein [Candidatus Diapherotrites archaeon]
MGDLLCIGIPARNEEESIEATIRSIVESDAWKDSSKSGREMIVCVNDSTDRTAEIVRNLQKEIPEIKLIENKEPGKNLAINTIIKNSSRKADVIYFSDADVVVAKDSIGKVAGEVRRDRKIDFAAPVPVPTSVFTETKKRRPVAAFYAEGSEIGIKHKIYRLTGMGFAARKSVLVKKPLPEHPYVGDDRYINLEYKGRIKVLYDAEVYFRPPSLKDHMRQRIRHAVERRTLFKIRPDLREPYISEAKKIRSREISHFRELSLKGKLGFLPIAAAEPLEKLIAKFKRAGTWSKIQSTKARRKV